MIACKEAAIRIEKHNNLVFFTKCDTRKAPKYDKINRFMYLPNCVGSLTRRNCKAT